MPDAPYLSAHISEIEPLLHPDPGEPDWRPIRHRFGIRAFGVNAWIGLAEGDFVIEEHTEETTSHEELYLVTSGRATFTVGERTVDAPEGTLVFVRDPELRRAAVAEVAGTTVLTVGAKPGEAFQVSAWEKRCIDG